MSKLEQAARQALEALESAPVQYDFNSYPMLVMTPDTLQTTLTALREALAEQAKQEPVATHICNLWVAPITKEYVVDHCDHPIEELIPAYSTSQYLSKKPDYWLGYGLQAYTQKPFEGATPLYTHPVRTKNLTDDEIRFWIGRFPFLLNEESEKWVIGLTRAVIAAFKEKNK